MSITTAADQLTQADEAKAKEYIVTCDDIFATSLWRSAFTCSGVQLEDSARNRLRSEFEGFRLRANDLVAFIHCSLPDLTIHDVTHLDALWRVASLLAGEDYPLNPLEAYVLGGAILLHDAALCIEAYEGGLEGIRATNVWKDSFALEQQRNPDTPLQAMQMTCDFAAMRSLHADRAGELAQYVWKGSNNKSDVVLITDPTLRDHVGKVIGQIASSHHWSIEEIRDKLARQLNPPSGYPTNWQVDAIKIACLLRTADAAHFCQDRAPDFLHALKQRSGVSGDHWSAQNRITGPTALNTDQMGKTIAYTSTQDFTEADSKAWWVAFDTLKVVQREISDANALLTARKIANSPPLKVTSVAGVTSVSNLAEFIRPSGWEPCDVNIHISDVESLIRNLGGEKLYLVTTKEQKIYVVLRELIQNARDSIIALRTINSEFFGEITLRIIDDGADQWIQIEDNGIGMSKRVITGALLDFGNSFWSSNLVKTELPGLRAKGYKSVGKFGIGFYSIFMIAADASVSSRRWNDGAADVVQLLFPAGLSMRPTVKSGQPAHHRWASSTVIKIKLREDCKFKDIKAIPVPSGITGVPDFSAPFADLVASWVTGIDVPVKFVYPSGEVAEIHGGNPGINPAPEKLLSQLSLSDFSGDRRQSIEENIKAHINRMRPVGQKKYGMAAIQHSAGTGVTSRGLRSVGGLGEYQMHGDSTFVGYIECEPDSARRGAGRFLAPPDEIKKWAIEQVDLFEKTKPNDFQRAVFGSSLCAFGVDPIDVARIFIHVDEKSMFVSFDELSLYAAKQPILFTESAYAEVFDAYAHISAVPGLIVVRIWTHGKFSILERDGNKPKEPHSILGCLSRAIEKSGFHMVINSATVNFVSSSGQPTTFVVSAIAN